LRRSPPASRADLTRELAVLYDETDCISSDIHRFSHELHPAVLDRLGLSTALRRYSVEVSEHRRISIHMCVDGEEPRMSSEIALAFFRIGQECLTNVAKHSGATECKVSLTYSSNRIRLVVQDDGHGFDPNDGQNKMGLGIQSMRERLRSIGGSLSIKSSLRRGTSVIAEAPIGAAAQSHSPDVTLEERPEGRSTASLS
jgi:signal transduction histidine kinase